MTLLVTPTKQNGTFGPGGGPQIARTSAANALLVECERSDCGVGC